MKKEFSGKMVLALVLALLLGACTSGLAAIFSVSGAMAYMLVFIAPFLAMFLYGLGGILPAAVMLSVLEIGTAYTLGRTWALAMLPAVALPSAVMIFVSQKGLPFFRQVHIALAAQAAGLIALVAAAYAYFQADLGTVAADYLRSSVNALPEDIQATLAATFRQVFGQVGIQMPEMDAELLNMLFDQYEQAIKMSLPSFMVMAVEFNAGLGVLIGNWQRARRGEENVQFMGTGHWHLSVGTTLGITFSLIATAIFMRTGSEQWTMVFSVMLTVASLACLTQAADSILFRMRVAGVNRGKRIAIFLLVFLLLGVYLVPYGATSAYFGGQGVFTKMLKAKVEKMQQDKEDHEE